MTKYCIVYDGRQTHLVFEFMTIAILWAMQRGLDMARVQIKPISK
jgi:hypothetical protein